VVVIPTGVRRLIGREMILMSGEKNGSLKFLSSKRPYVNFGDLRSSRESILLGS